MKTIQPWIDNPFKLISWLDMLRISANEYVSIGSFLKWMSTAARFEGIENEKEVREVISAAARHVALPLTAIGCTVLANSANRIVKDAPSISEEVLKARAAELRQCISDELDGHVFFWVPAERSKFYGDLDKSFGEDVQNRFASTLSEIKEAGNCIAFGAYTASVFHLMRVMEVGLKSAYISLGLHFDSNLSWEKILRNWDKDEIKNDPIANAKMMERLPFYQSLRATASSVKDAVRNPTIHFDRSYDESEALETLTAVRGFMKVAATGLDDSWRF